MVSSRYSPDPIDRLVATFWLSAGLSSWTNTAPRNLCHSSLHVYKVSFRYIPDPTDRLVAKVAGSLARLILLLATVAIVLYMCIW